MKAVRGWGGLVLLVASLPLRAQEAPVESPELRVKVLSKEGGRSRPVPGATVRWLNASVVQTSDSAGWVRIPRPAGATQLIISAFGFQADTLTPGDSRVLAHVLAQAYTTSEVEITGRAKSSGLDRLDPRNTLVVREKELFKAACCNLSESFETNPSVDVAFADAVTGARQIQMLGLAGTYTQITSENIPGVRGLSALYGLQYVPGTWVEGLQVSKGAGSVANGFESVTGQINIEQKKPHTGERIYLNGYINQMGRTEGNIVLNHRLNERWSTSLLTHGDFWGRKVDENMDMFLDVPLSRQYSLAQRWKYQGENGLEGIYGVKVLGDYRQAGMLDYQPGQRYDVHSGVHGSGTMSPWGSEQRVRRLEFSGKTGYVWQGRPYQSVGLIVQAVDHRLRSHYGPKAWDADQKSLYTNLIFQSIIGTTEHKFRTGLSWQLDQFTDRYLAQSATAPLDYRAWDRQEWVPGAFYEHTWSPREDLTFIGGIRADYNNLFGAFVTPRFHGLYSVNDKTVLRASWGRGQRTAHILAENPALLVSNRSLVIQSASPNSSTWGLAPEVAWNQGLSLTRDGQLLGRSVQVTLDYFYTWFENQIVADLDANPQEVRLYNLKGSSYSHSFQATADVELLPRLDLRLAWRMYDVQTTLDGRLRERPLVSRQRAFANLAWESSQGLWKADATLQWYGAKRLPKPSAEQPGWRSQSPDYFVLNAQVTRTLGPVDVYLGAENLGDFRQMDLIAGASHPERPGFDASMVWGPVLPRMVYAGFRYKLP